MPLLSLRRRPRRGSHWQSRPSARRACLTLRPPVRIVPRAHLARRPHHHGPPAAPREAILFRPRATGACAASTKTPSAQAVSGGIRWPWVAARASGCSRRATPGPGLRPTFPCRSAAPRVDMRQRHPAARTPTCHSGW